MEINTTVDMPEIYGKNNKLIARQALANQILADSNRFVPMKDGDLRTATSIAIDGSEITYHMKYAHYQYANQFKNYTTPGTGPHWDEKAKGMFMKDWKKAYVGGLGL